MLGEIKKSVDTASRNPNRFKLTNVEIQGRRGWMDSVGRRVETLRSQVWGLIRVNTGATEFTSTSAKPLTTTTQGANMTANMTTNMTTPKPTTTKTKTNANMDSFIASETAQQQQMIVRQDQELDVLGASSLLPLPRLSLPLSLSLFLFFSLSLVKTPAHSRRRSLRSHPPGAHVLRIGELGKEMGQELDAQGELLDEFGYEMVGTQTRCVLWNSTADC